MFRSPQTMLDYEARKNPALASLISNLHNLTPDEIKSHPLRMLPWVRQQLVVMKRGIDSRAVIDATARSLEGLIVDGIIVDPMGETRRWIGGNEFIRLSRGHLEIRYGELFWLDQNGGAWLDSIYCRPFDPCLLTASQTVGTMSRLAYMDALRDKARGDVSAGTPILGGFQQPSVLASAGVRFYGI